MRLCPCRHADSEIFADSEAFKDIPSVLSTPSAQSPRSQTERIMKPTSHVPDAHGRVGIQATDAFSLTTGDGEASREPSKDRRVLYGPKELSDDDDDDECGETASWRAPAPAPKVMTQPPMKQVANAVEEPTETPVVPAGPEEDARSIIDCTIKGCNENFPTLKLMKRHKKAQHDYCKLCDKDFEDYDAYFQHKIKSDSHIVCEICGADFRTPDGKNEHFRQVRQRP